jgi:hypothetical protein
MIMKILITIAIIYASMFAGARIGTDRMNRSAEFVIDTVKSGCEFVAEKTMKEKTNS